MLKKLARRMVLYASQTRLYTYLLRHVVPYIRFTTYYPTFTGKQYFEGAHQLLPGDIVLCTDKRKLTTVLIGGEFTHAAICIGAEVPDEDPVTTLDMTHEDCRKASFFDICKESDRVVIIRATNWGHDYTQKVVERAKWFHRNGAKYDYQFDLGVKALYCSELIFQSDFEHRLGVSLDDVAGLGIPYISPDGLFNSENTTLVFDSEYL